MPLIRFAHSCHIFMTSQTRGNILYTTGCWHNILVLRYLENCVIRNKKPNLINTIVTQIDVSW